MEYRENPLLGRKVFFLNPPLSVENYVIEALKNEEYEVYKLTDVTVAKPILSLFENAICFIFVDDVLSLDAWYNFIASFQDDPALKSVFLGVLSVKTKPKEQERFLMSLKLPGGFVMMDKKVEETKNQLEGILRINGAKGIRQCVRLDLKDSKDVNGYFSLGSQLFSFRLIDISQMGFAAVMPARISKYFKKGSFLHNVSITMGRYSFVCSINVYGVTLAGDQCILVALLVDGTSKEVLQKIHNFVFENLEKRMKDLIASVNPDLTDYNVRFKADSASEEEVVEDVEELDDSSSSDSEKGKQEKSAGDKVESDAPAESNSEQKEESEQKSEKSDGAESNQAKKEDNKDEKVEAALEEKNL